jgi:hypothetical protein
VRRANAGACFGDRPAQLESGAGVGARNAQLTTMAARQSCRVAKTDTCAASAGGLRRAEQRCNAIRIDARPLIGDAEQNTTADITHADDDLATLGREVDRIQQ